MLFRIEPIGKSTQDLFPEELQAISRAVVSRQYEFATGRRLSRHLLSELGYPAQPLLPDEHRLPIWPKGVVGSISHTKTMCAVAIAPSDQITSIGLDIEEPIPLNRELWELIATAEELPFLREHSQYTKLLFSAKECFYKWQYPLHGIHFGFHDVHVTIDINKGQFQCDTPVLESIPTGEFTITPDWILTVMHSPAPLRVQRGAGAKSER